MIPVMHVHKTRTFILAYLFSQAFQGKNGTLLGHLTTSLYFELRLFRTDQLLGRVSGRKEISASVNGSVAAWKMGGPFNLMLPFAMHLHLLKCRIKSYARSLQHIGKLCSSVSGCV